MNITVAIENANLCGKNIQYLHFAEICDKMQSGNMWNMWESHIRVKLTCLYNDICLLAACDFLSDLSIVYGNVVLKHLLLTTLCRFELETDVANCECIMW